MTPLVAFLLVVFAYSLVSSRLERSAVTAPIVFMVAGMLAFFVLAVDWPFKANLDFLLKVAELGLVLLLFTDASRTDLRVLSRIRGLPVRLLSTGMLLTIVLGAVVALGLFPQLSLWEAGILAAILAPTDAGLGQVIVNSPRVPTKIRQALNVEAGLNDGLSVPFLLFFIALATQEGEAAFGRFVLEQLGYGALIGLGVGLIGGWALGWAHRARWVTHSWSKLGLVALPVLCLLVSEATHASMFIAAFVAGLSVQAGFKNAGSQSVEFAEDWGQLFNLAVFFLFGLMSIPVWERLHWTHALYAGLSLTAIRMLPVALALRGTRLSAATVVFMGWFGPRGLASIVLGLVYLGERANHPGEDTIRLAVFTTVFLSVLAHGLSARTGVRLYERRIMTLPPDAPERLESDVGAGAPANRTPSSPHPA